MRVLLVEDEPEPCATLQALQPAAAYALDRVRSLEEALAALSLGDFALVLLERRLPDGDGLSLLSEIKARQPTAAVIILSAQAAPGERAAGLDAGADDYLAKPFHREELHARMRAALRRRLQSGAPPIVCGGLTYLPDRREVSVDGAPLVFRRRELALLEALILRAGRVVPRESLLRRIYGFEEEPSSNTLEAQMSRLRGRLRRAGAGVAIRPVRGVGYLLERA